MAKKVHRHIWAVKNVKSSQEGVDDKSYWTQIGVTFKNGDESENLYFDYYPTDPSMTIQLRFPKAKD